MVEFDVVAALVGGLVATVVMSGMMTMATGAGLTAMPPMPLVVGSMMSGDRRTATGLGALLHYVVMGTVVFGLGYGALFAAFHNDGWWVGALIGLVHGFVVGLVFMPMMPAMHSHMISELVAAGATTLPSTVGTDDHGHVQLTAPGVLGRNWGTMTPAGLVMGHVVYGVVLALVYGWIA